MRNKLKNIYYKALHFVRYDKLKISEIRRRRQLIVLNLHRVSPDRNPFSPPMAPDVFEELLIFLKENFEVTTFGELKDVQDSDKTPAILSFDDGYYDFIEHAAPLLRKFNLRANMNVIPSCVESGKPIWNVQLYDFLNSATPEQIGGLGMFPLEDKSDSGKLRLGLKLSGFLKKRPFCERQKHWQKIENKMKEIEFPMTKVMSADDIKSISETHEIGVHSFSHESMAYEEDEFFEEDFERCKDYFSTKLNLPLNIYAFPNGSYRPNQIETLRKNGVEHILLVNEDYAQRGDSVYPRFTMYGDSPLQARFLALGHNRKSI